MKKLILPLLLLVAIGMLAAVESDPSNIVGYFKKTINTNSWQAVALPFAYPDLGIIPVMGQQFDGGDIMIDLNSGSSADYFDDYGFYGGLENLEYGVGYRIFRDSANPQTDYYFLGEVDPQDHSLVIQGNGAWTAFGLNEATNINFDGADDLFGTNETDESLVIELDTGYASDYFTGYGWYGGIANIQPTFGYRYKSVAGDANFTWNYSSPNGSAKKNVT